MRIFDVFIKIFVMKINNSKQIKFYFLNVKFLKHTIIIK